MDLNSLTALELRFGEQFDTLLFPVLANHYLNKGDFVRTVKVCEIGLEYHPENTDGLYVLGKAQQALDDYVNAEKSFKSAIKNGTVHLQAALALVEVQIELKRAKTSVIKTCEQILKWDPGNEKAQAEVDSSAKQKTGTELKETSVKTAALIREPDSIDINPRLATFTMVAVLRNQSLHFQALQVLDILEEKGDDPQRIATERESIKESMEI